MPDLIRKWVPVDPTTDDPHSPPEYEITAWGLDTQQCMLVLLGDGTWGDSLYTLDSMLKMSTTGHVIEVAP